MLVVVVLFAVVAFGVRVISQPLPGALDVAVGVCPPFPHDEYNLLTVKRGNQVVINKERVNWPWRAHLHLAAGTYRLSALDDEPVTVAVRSGHTTRAVLGSECG